MEPTAYAQLPVRRLTRVVGGVLVAILALAAAGLYGLPGETERLFAWTVEPDLTALMMGAGYASGIVFFFFVARGPRWLEVSFGFVGITVFATLMAIATFVHWDRFNHDHPAFIGWVALYAVTPILVPLLWVYNGGWRPGPVEPPDVEVPRGLRLCLGVVGGLLFAVGVAIFVHPEFAIDHWPWDVTPLTARVVASFTALNVGWAAASFDRRWAALRIPCVSSLTGWLLLLIGMVRADTDVHGDRVTSWVYIGVALAVVALLSILLYTMSARRSSTPPELAPAA